VNGRAGRVRRSLGLVARLRAQLPPNRLAVTDEPGDVPTALRHFHDAGVDALCIVGGDGTVTGTLSPLVEVWDDRPLPSVCLMPGGTINTIAQSLGIEEEPDRALARLLRDEAETRRLRILAVRPAAGPARFGMIFGLGVVARWLGHYYASRSRGSSTAALGVARSAASVVLGGAFARSLFAPFDAKLEADGEPVERERLTGLAAAVVRDIGLGFRPFFLAGRDPDRFHWITTDSSGPGIVLELPAAALGRTLPGGPLRHARAHRLRIRLSDPLPYTVDGDLFPASGALELDAGPELHFLVP
jgi:diacylglycerol kinase family enzyme